MKQTRSKTVQKPKKNAAPEKAAKRFDIRKITENKSLRKAYDSGIPYFILAFLIPSVIMLVAFSFQNIHPFGDNQMLVVDLWHQYYPFFRVVREKLVSGGSFLYSWDTGIGTNFLALIAYYAMSPLNWLAVFFDEEHTRDALTYFLIAKVGFSGAFTSVFLRYTYKHKDFSTVVFSTMFALCSFTLGYYWNVMWFDTIALFPLVMTGVVALCREGKWKLYTVSLALALICNYYIGYMVCIFTMIMFAAASIIECGGVKDFFLKLWLIIRSSVIGIGLGGFILLPAYLALKLAYQQNKKFEFKIEWHEKWYDFIGNLISFNEPTDKEGLPNIACGMLAVVLVGVFLFSSGIKLKEKIMSALALVLIALSLNMRCLNFAWHGFHDTNQIPYRFAFIFSFVLLALAYRAYDIIVARGMKWYQLAMMAAGPLLVFIMRIIADNAKEIEFGEYKNEKSSLLIVGAFLLIFIAAKLIPFKSPVFRRSFMNVALAAAVFTELMNNASIGVKTVGTSGYSSYPANANGVAACMDIMEEQENPLFYRMEMANNYTINDGALYGYHGISQFSSTCNVSVTKFMKKLGLYGNDNANRWYYRTSTPVVNGLLGINYIMSKTESLDGMKYLEEIEVKDSVHLYRSTRPLSLGFMMDPQIQFVESTDNPFEYQNAILKYGAGVSNVFTARPVEMVDYQNMTVNKSGYGNYVYAVDDSTLYAGCTYDFASVPDAELYGFVRCSNTDKIVTKCNGMNTDGNINIKSYPVLFPLRETDEGGTLSVQFDVDREKSSGNYTIVVYAFNGEAFDRAYENLADEQLDITEFSDTKIVGTVDAKRRGIMYFSIPYEKGWEVYVDGERTRTMKLMDAMLGIEVGSGHHEITLKYAPDGFRTGLLISGGALLLMIVWAVCEMLAKKKRSNIGSSVLPEKKTKMDDLDGTEVSRDLGEAGIQINEKSESNDGISGN